MPGAQSQLNYRRGDSGDSHSLRYSDETYSFKHFCIIVVVVITEHLELLIVGTILIADAGRNPRSRFRRTMLNLVELHGSRVRRNHLRWFHPTLYRRDEVFISAKELGACNVVYIGVLSATFAQSSASTPNDPIMKSVTHIANNTLCSRHMRGTRLAACAHDGTGRFRQPGKHFKHD